MIRLAFFALLCLGSASDAHAFKAKVHFEFTLAAFAQYVRLCETGIPRHRLAALGERLATGTQAEDDTELFSRITNWHFYGRGSIADRWWPHITLHNVYGQRVAKLQELMAFKPDPADRDRHFEELYTQAGRVLHYVEDMSVPAHVIPIYHISDAFDSFRPANPRQLEQALSAETCAEVAKEVRADDLKDLITNTAERTLISIGQRAAAAPQANESWSKYWGNPQIPDEQSLWLAGFATYKNECIFQLAGKPGPEPSGCASDEQLETLFESSYLQVMKDAFRVLRYLERVWKND
jgi:hypothetical protein